MYAVFDMCHFHTILIGRQISSAPDSNVFSSTDYITYLPNYIV